MRRIKRFSLRIRRRCNLGLAALHGFGRRAMLPSCTYSSVFEAIEFKGRAYVNLTRPPLKNTHIFLGSLGDLDLKTLRHVFTFFVLKPKELKREKRL